MGFWAKSGGIIGSVVTLFGIMGGLIIGNFTHPFIVAHLVIGLLFLVVWAVSGGLEQFSNAGAALTGRRARYGANFVLATVVFSGFLVVANWFAHRYQWRADLTEEGVFSLAPQSRKVIEELKKPLKIVALKTINPGEDFRTKELLDLYKFANSSKVTIDILDPRSKPHMVEAYDMKQGNLIYLEYGEGDQKGVSRLNTSNEQEITNGILKLTRGEARKVYYLVGHEEPALDGTTNDGLRAFADGLKDEHLTVEKLHLAQKNGQVPADAAALIVASPKQPLLPEEIEGIYKYVDGGGSLLLLNQFRGGDDVRAIAKHYGIEVRDDVVVDQLHRMLANFGTQFYVDDFTPHPITQGFSPDDPALFSQSQSVVAPRDSDATPGVVYTTLVKSGPNSWGETNLGMLLDTADPAAEPDDEDPKGPLSLAVVYEKTLEAAPASDGAKDASAPRFEKRSRVVVFGSTDFLKNGIILKAARNRDLALNTVSWLAGEEGGLSIRPASFRASEAPIPATQFLTILAGSFVIPELILLGGLLVWWKRRHPALA